MEETALLRVVPFRSVFAGIALSVAVFFPIVLPGYSEAVRPQYPPGPRNIVIGFTGGFVKHDNRHHAPVQLAQRIRQTAPAGTYVEIFENRHRKQAKHHIDDLLDTNHDGILSAEEKNHAHILLYGHSWGAAAVVLLARDLQREGVPVALTVQVDSVAKPWQNDTVIPDNVAEAINIYQTHGIVHGRKEIRAADPTRTHILGNDRMDYRESPVQCPQPALWDRVFTPDHMQSECDPQIWSRVEKMLRERLAVDAVPPRSNRASSQP
jgi:hypothetical protein